MTDKKISLLEAIEQLKKKAEKPFTVMMKHGTMSVEYFAPQKTDTQSPHEQDELYVIARGHGQFNRNGEMIEFKAGDVLFVPTGMEHRFENFTDDFATWVIFYGKQGGEENLKLEVRS
ncbi:MAG: cupin domain-containing protein [Chitinophagaceae bacterium]|nr:cupin domain-containing protein [Chitinophagaceae bacterium]